MKNYQYGTINPDGTVGDVTIFNTDYYGIYIQQGDSYYWLTETTAGSALEFDHFPTLVDIKNYISKLAL